MNKIRWGIIGCGDVTEVKSGPGFQYAKNSELVAVMRRNSALAKNYAARHHVPKWYDNAEELINDNDVDAVYIATPPSSHKEYTIKVAKAGKPVYVEKPMAMNFQQCNDMIHYCRQRNVPLFVAYYRRALPRFLKIKDLVENESIGQVRFININFYKKPFPNDLKGKYHWRIDPEIAGCGYFCDLASHMFDILQYFLGEIESAKGFSSNQANLYRAEDMVSAVFLFKSGIHGTGVWNFNAYTENDSTEIIGDKGKITYSTFGNSPLLLEDERGIKQFEIENPKHIQQPLIQSVVDELLGRGKCPSTGESGAKTNWVIDEILGKRI